MASDGFDNRDFPTVEQVTQIANLANAGVDIVILDGFADANGHGLHIPPGHAPIGVQSFINDHEVSGFVVNRLVVDGKPPSDIYQVVLFTTHPRPVGIGTKLKEYVGDRRFLIARLPFLNEESVFDHAGGIEVEPNVVEVAKGADGFDIGHADRLASGHIDGARHADIGDVFGADPMDQSIEFVEVHIPFEGV